ncbi:hypothetical protein PCS70_06690 [Bifidobacterium longum]|uniref:hypothetical protein n=1 Tax=Bifidobacterium longum TaxID=216816 RepID=UPI0023EA8FF0|nr:hypothetical protein [Bifidobacterium longum]MDF4081203.1 hypothetical protein [Bifidobacterium longum]
MAQIPSGFTFNDDITEDASERFPPPALGSTSINWNDAGSVYDAIQQVSEQFKQAFADLIDQSAKGTDNSVESRLFFTIAAYSAMNELHDMTAPILSSTLMNQHPDWVPVINGCESKEELMEAWPDVKTVHDAQIQANKTGRPVRVHLKDADVDAIISVQPIKEEDFHAERAA